MAFLMDVEELKPGLIIFRRGDVQHRRWYCRIKVPDNKAAPDKARYKDRYKTVSLKTTDINAARTQAWDQESEVRHRVKLGVPVFNKPFSQVAEEYVAQLELKARNGKVTPRRVKVVASIVKAQLDPYVGSTQIHLIGEELWENYPSHRRASGTGRYNGRVSDATIRLEVGVLRSILDFAVRKKYRSASDTFDTKLDLERERRDEFTPEEYRKLHSFARSWVKKAPDENRRWYRAMAYNFVLIMCNTGMRPSEAKNLRWRDVELRQDKEGRKLVVLQVRGKKKERQLVAAANVGEYLKRVRQLSRWKEPDDPVFSVRDSTPTGRRVRPAKGAATPAPAASGNWKSASSLYKAMVRDLLEQSGLLVGQNGKQRSTYCFRHTYATFRLSEGVDVYFLAHQMGTSVRMIEQHYGHANAVRNAASILRGLPGWEPGIEASPPALVTASPARRAQAGGDASRGTGASPPRKPRYRARPPALAKPS